MKPGAPARLKMKDLERATGVGREAVRYYIREGLLPEPHRPGRNVAWYDQSFVERIQLIKQLQERRFLPLRVIKSIVAGDSPPSIVEQGALAALDGRLPPAADLALEPPPEQLAALAARTGVPIDEIQTLAANEAITLVTRGGKVWLEGPSIQLVELWARLRAAGFTAESGFGPEKARLYVDMVRWLAREELREFTHAFAGRVGADELVRLAEEGIRLGSEMIALLRRAALLRFVAEGNPAVSGNRTDSPQRGHRAERPPPRRSDRPDRRRSR